MFAWAGNATSPGGFHRIRRGAARAGAAGGEGGEGSLSVTFSDPIDPTDCAMKVWSLKRTKNYGSKHHDEHELTIRSVKLSEDKKHSSRSTSPIWLRRGATNSKSANACAARDDSLHGSEHRQRLATLLNANFDSITEPCLDHGEVVSEVTNGGGFHVDIFCPQSAFVNDSLSDSTQIIMKHILASLLIAASLQAKPLKVFILAGQSNMEGHAKIETFDYIGDDPATAPLLKMMRG
jgi:hypothetical protein